MPIGPIFYFTDDKIFVVETYRREHWWHGFSWTVLLMCICLTVSLCVPDITTPRSNANSQPQWTFWLIIRLDRVLTDVISFTAFTLSLALNADVQTIQPMFEAPILCQKRPACIRTANLCMICSADPWTMYPLYTTLVHIAHVQCPVVPNPAFVVE